MWLISLSGSCMVFTKAVFNGLLAPLDFCNILIVFAGSVEFHSSPPPTPLPPQGCLRSVSQKGNRKERWDILNDFELKAFPSSGLVT